MPTSPSNQELYSSNPTSVSSDTTTLLHLSPKKLKTLPWVLGYSLLRDFYVSSNVGHIQSRIVKLYKLEDKNEILMVVVVVLEIIGEWEVYLRQEVVAVVVDSEAKVESGEVGLHANCFLLPHPQSPG